MTVFGYDETHSKHDLSSIFTNPNLIINGDFQVWQRGESFDLKADRKVTYTADRWMIYTSNSGLVKKVKNGIEITNHPHLAQFLESKLIEGMKYNVSFKLNGIVFSRTITGGTYFTESNFKYSLGINGFEAIEILLNQSATNTIEYVKLGFGELATPNVPRSYGEELALCHRYTYVMDSKTYYENYGTFVMYSNKAQLYYAFDAETMRIKPSASWGTFSGITLFAIRDFTNIEISGKVGIAYVSGCLLLEMINTYLNGLSGSWQLRPNTQIIFDAEIY